MSTFFLARYVDADDVLRRTYGATLAELTSLEELMKTLMLDGQIHPDVINKLWHVYSKSFSFVVSNAQMLKGFIIGVDREIPRCQRRGAIIILGMIAVAKPEVVSERLETLLRVGLGRFGKVQVPRDLRAFLGADVELVKADLVLSRYTCIALQRLGGSTKKVKGSLTDKSTRFPMDHLLFRKLQDAMEHTCQSMDWCVPSRPFC